MIQFPFRRRRDSLVPGRYVLLLRLRPREVNRQKWNHYLPISRAWRGKCTFSAFLDENVCNSRRIDSLKWNQISSFYQPISSDNMAYIFCCVTMMKLESMDSSRNTLHFTFWVEDDWTKDSAANFTWTDSATWTFPVTSPFPVICVDPKDLR